MSNENRFDPLGLAELESNLAPESMFPESMGLPASRAERIESRRAFVEMKQLFMRAVENLEHRKGAWLRAQVRGADDPIDLWLLRSPLLATLREDDVATRTMRAALYKSLDRTFPEAFGSAEITTQSSLRA
ncbi:MAG: hypothetical protein ABJD97_17750 [Betaproteobacteria bacterium]